MNSLTLALLFKVSTSSFGLPPYLLDSLCFVESGYNIQAVHHDDGNSDSLGVCQIKAATARWLGFQGKDRDLMDPRINIHYAAKYLAYQMDRYDGDVIKAVVAYNMGSARRFTSTKYSDKVILRWRQNGRRR
jgi:soluble lytic murein transglycosylase-like protein